MFLGSIDNWNDKGKCRKKVWEKVCSLKEKLNCYKQPMLNNEW